jgi:hypothetical protein
MDSRVMRKSGKRSSQSPKRSSGKALRSQAKVVINAFLLPIVSMAATGLATFAWNRIVQPTGYYSYSHSEKEIVSTKILSSRVFHTFVKGVKGEPSSGDENLIRQAVLYLHEFEILPRAHTSPGEDTVTFDIPKGATLYDCKITDNEKKEYDCKITYTKEGEDSETDVAHTEEPIDGPVSVKAQFIPGDIETLTAEILLNKGEAPHFHFGNHKKAELQPTNPFPWDLAVPIVLILVFAIVSWNYQARPHLSLGDYERIALIIFLVILITPLLGGLFRSLLALPLKTYTFAKEDPQLADLAFPMWMGIAGTFLAGFLVVLAAEIVSPHGDNPTLARMQWWTTTGLFWGVVGSFLVSIAYEPESLKEIGWHSNGVRYGLIVTGILWGLGISLGGYFGQRVGSGFGQPLIGRACGAILGSLILLPISMLLTLVIFTYQTDERQELISRSCGEALSQWLCLVFILLTYYLAKARLESSRNRR